MSKSLIFTVLALILGVVGWYFIFPDLSSSESWAGRILIASVFFFLSGLAIGFFNPGAWLLSGLTAWGAILMGAFIIIGAARQHGSNTFGVEQPPYIFSGLVLLFIPVGLALAGGYVGKLLSKKNLVMLTNSTV